MPETSKAKSLPVVKEKAPIAWAPTLIFSITFLISVTAVPLYGIMSGYDAIEWLVFAVMLAFCGFSITGGYHRLWSHRAYDANPLVKAFFAFWGACALQNSILIWSSGHRKHHRYVDDVDQDPYSVKRGLWFAHIGWMLRNYKSGAVDLNNTQDLQRDKIVMFQHNYYVPLVLLSNIGVPLILGYLNGDILGMLLLAGVLRLVISHHVTFFINSLCHAWGKQPYTNTNTAKDNFLLALFTYGEGYHNFHHYFQTDYRNGVRWWQFDPTKWMINAMSWVGLASNLKRVPNFKIQEAMLQMQFEKARKQLSLSHLPTPNVEALRQALEAEYQQFMDTLAEWKELRGQWVQQKRDAFEEKKQEWQSMWQHATLRTRFKEMEYMLKMQRKRIHLFTLNFVTPTSA